MFIHHEDEQLLGRHFGAPEAIPESVRVAYAKCAKFWHGAIGGSGPLPGGSLITLVAIHEMQGTVLVPAATVAPKVVQEEESPPPVGDVHSPMLDLAVNTAVRAKGKLGYYVGPWGTEKMRVRLEGEDKYSVFHVNDVEIAV